jgi:hypothetical protein
LKKAIKEIEDRLNSKNLSCDNYLKEKAQVNKDFDIYLNEFQDETGIISMYLHFENTNNSYWGLNLPIFESVLNNKNGFGDIYFKSEEILKHFSGTRIYKSLKTYFSPKNAENYQKEISKTLSDYNYAYNLNLLDVIYSNDKDAPENLFSILKLFNSARFLLNIDETIPKNIIPDFIEFTKFNSWDIIKELTFSEFTDGCLALQKEMVKREFTLSSDNEKDEANITILSALFLLVNYYGRYKNEKPEFWNTFNSEASILFFNNYINQTIGTIKNSIRSLKDVSQISLSRIDRKRFFSLDDKSIMPEMCYSLLNRESEQQERCYSFINKWLTEFEFGKKLLIKDDKETGNIKLYIQDFNNEEMLLADCGSGTWQFVALLLEIVNFTYRLVKNNYGEIEDQPRVLILEEPEANLHPRLQALLADFMVDASKEFNIQFIVETHSDLIIRKLQLLAAKYEDYNKRTKIAAKNKDFAQLSILSKEKQGYMQPDDVKIYYFEKRLNTELKYEHHYRTIKIIQGGSLSEKIPEDFYDASVNLQFELLKLSNSQHN